MASCIRLISRKLLKTSNYRPISLIPCRTVTIVPKPAENPGDPPHDEKNKKLWRPLSPHLTIYKFQLTSLLSITHRLTGIGLGLFTAEIGISSLISSKPFVESLQLFNGLPPDFLLLGKFLMGWAFAFHFCNGIRHLVWDTGRSLTLSQVYMSGLIMLVASIAISIVLIDL